MTWHCGLLVGIVLAASIVPDVRAQDKAAKAPSKISWKKTIVDKAFRSEGVAVADVNKDGKPDIIVGDVWYEAPNWKMHSLRKERDPKRAPNHQWNPKEYSESFAVFAGDFNGDGYPDVIVIPFPGKACYWYENPKGTTELWKEHLLTNSACNETPIYVDLFKTGKKVLVMGWRPPGKAGAGEVCYFQPGKDPTQPWERYSISGPSKDGKDMPGSFHYYHGLGAGDINGDGRNDVIIPDGWWEQPPTLPSPRGGEERVGGGQPWTWHPVPKRIGPNCADMHVLDVDGDGKADVISSSAHGYGLWWHQQKPGNVFLTHDFFPSPPQLAKLPPAFKANKEEQALYAGVSKWREERKKAPWRADAELCEDARNGAQAKKRNASRQTWIKGSTIDEVLANLQAALTGSNWMNAGPGLTVGVGFDKGTYTLALVDKGLFSLPGQTHALHLVDINGDGLKDLVTGRRYWAHGPTGDVSPQDPPYVYWFEARRGPDGVITFIPHQVDDDSGIGTQFEVADINGDGLPDIIVSNKHGVYVFEQVRSTKE